MGIFRKKQNSSQTEFKMICTEREGYYSFNGKLYQSDIIKSCIRPQVRAIGKLKPVHVRRGEGDIQRNPDAYMRLLLKEPNPIMSMQMFLQKMCSQLILNNNAFALIVRDSLGVPSAIYPVPCRTAETIYINDRLHIKFQYKNGKNGTFPYEDIIHLREDFNDGEVFGDETVQTLMPLMEILTTIDQGLVKAIKNSGIIRWLLKYNTPMKSEDLKRNVKEFVDNYLGVESSTFGAAGVDARADAIRIEPKDYVPNALMNDKLMRRAHSFFNTNEKIITSDFTEDEWNSTFESVIEPKAIQLSDEFTRKLFTRKQRAFGNEIIFEASNLACASLTTKLALREMVDRGALKPNEWRETMNLAPVEGGDVPLRRKDTGIVTEGGAEGED